MSYKTNAKALRLGISHDWSFKAHGPMPNLHLDHKLMQFVTNMVEHVVPQAPQRAKTKGRFLKKFAASPGIQGKTFVLRGSNHVQLVIYFYLNLNGAEEHQRQDLFRNFTNIVWLLRSETGYRVQIAVLNYFSFFWRLKLFTGRRMYRKLRGRIQQCIGRHDFLQRERLCYTAYTNKLRKTRRALRRFRRERYFSRSLKPLIAAFISEDFDAGMAAKTIALELQILRIYHKRFMRYVKKVLQMGFYYWNKSQLLEGLRIEVKGRMTDYRRQVRRAQTKTMSFGTIKKSSLRVESSHCRHLAYNRYGVISVSITFQQRPVIAEKWEDRVAQSPLRAFSLRQTLEDWADSQDKKLSPKFSIQHSSYGIEPLTILDNHKYMEQLWEKYKISTLSINEKKHMSKQPGLEIINRFLYVRERHKKYHCKQQQPFYRNTLKLNLIRLSRLTGYSQKYYFPLDLAELSSFQYKLRRLNLNALKKQPLKQPSNNNPVPPTPKFYWTEKKKTSYFGLINQIDWKNSSNESYIKSKKSEKNPIWRKPYRIMHGVLLV